MPGRPADGVESTPAAHGHGHDDGRPFATRLHALTDRRVLLGSVVAIVVLTVVGLVLLWPGHVAPVTDFEGENYSGERVEADVTSVVSGDCSYATAPGEFTCDAVDFRVSTGAPAGDTDTLEVPFGIGGPKIHTGDRIILYYSATAPEGAHYQFADFQRSTPMLVLAALFVAVVVAFGRWRGLIVIAGVVVSMVVLVGFVLPALLNGEAPSGWRSPGRPRLRWPPCTSPTACPRRPRSPWSAQSPACS